MGLFRKLRGPDRMCCGSRIGGGRTISCGSLRPGSSLQYWLIADNPNEVGTAIAGVAHVEMGMLRAIHVE